MFSDTVAINFSLASLRSLMLSLQGELRNPAQNMCLDSAVRPDNMHKPVKMFCFFLNTFIFLYLLHNMHQPVKNLIFFYWETQ